MITVNDCSPICSCDVQTNNTGGFIAAKFIPANSSRGLVNIKQLQTYTMYSFEANCSGAAQTKMYAIRTDVSRPSPPHNPSVALNGHQLQLTWLPSRQPYGPIDEYRVTVDGTTMKPALNNTNLFYRMKQNYVAGAKHTMAVSACNMDTQNRTLCSDPKQAQASFSPNKNSSLVIPTQSASLNRLPFALLVFVSTLLLRDVV